MSVATNRVLGSRSDSSVDIEARFRTLVQSPLRAGLLRFLSARPGEPFEVESLMATFGRLRLDVENCLRELVEFGIIRRAPGSPAQYSAVRPEGDAINRLLDTFLERRADISTEDQAPSVQRIREMIRRKEKTLTTLFRTGIAPKSHIAALSL